MCASGNAAMITAKCWLDAGIVDDVVVAATDISCIPENTAHFVKLGVAITDTTPLDACRPFQTGSRGFAMGEASVAFVLSGSSGQPYTRVLGGAMSHDAYHITSIDPGLGEVARCFEAALDVSGVHPMDVGYLHAHGPGTAQCDAAEAAMLERMFDPSTRVYSIKPLVGHCQGAASAVEIAVTALAYERGVLPAPRAVSEAHPQLLHGLQPMEQRITAKSSLGMGGHNSMVLFGPAA
jgi:3-oxoacyl-[acyl-carrier-protein] synthase II